MYKFFEKNEAVFFFFFESKKTRCFIRKGEADFTRYLSRFSFSFCLK